MVWQKGILGFFEFFVLFVPSVVNYVIPAAIMHFFVPNDRPVPNDDVVEMKDGAKRIMVLFGLTIVTAVSFHQFLHLPPMLGMMTGLGYLKVMGFYLKKKAHRLHERKDTGQVGDVAVFDVFDKVARAEWDTLLFFYGVVLSVGGLGFMGYLALVSEIMYLDWGPTTANVLVGVLSAIVDNIPVMFAVLTMHPDMSSGQWLLVTLTAGVGGSMLSVGSAAGVALMGQSRGMYTFGSHLKWTPVIALGYGASIYTHIWINGL
jgi:Na+/H+ antiporter NhaD/arsenite permease-like protein